VDRTRRHKRLLIQRLKQQKILSRNPLLAIQRRSLGMGDSPFDSFGQGPPRLTGEEYFKASPDTSGFSSQEFNKNLITNQAVDPTALA
jgi:hypothetical protein